MNEALPIEVFIEGETIDLCVAWEHPWILEQWYRWFNDPNVTEYLAQGDFPNTLEKQREFIKGAEGNRLILMIKPKNEAFFVGVASLSDINYQQRQCHTAIVIGKKLQHSDAMFFGLEAKALITQHAFEKLGVERVNSTQVLELIKWQRTQFLFGFQIEGVLRNRIRKGIHCFDVMSSSCLLSDYQQIMRERKHYWPGKSALYRAMREISTDEPILKLQQQILATIEQQDIKRAQLTQEYFIGEDYE